MQAPPQRQAVACVNVLARRSLCRSQGEGAGGQFPKRPCRTSSFSPPWTVGTAVLLRAKESSCGSSTQFSGAVLNPARGSVSASPFRLVADYRSDKLPSVTRAIFNNIRKRAFSQARTLVKSLEPWFPVRVFQRRLHRALRCAFSAVRARAPATPLAGTLRPAGSGGHEVGSFLLKGPPGVLDESVSLDCFQAAVC